MKYLEQLLDALIKWEGQRLEINMLEPPFIFKDNKKNFLTKVPFTESEFNLIEFEYKEEFFEQQVFAYKDHYIKTSRSERARVFFLETEKDKTVDLAKLFQFMAVKKATDLHLTPRCKPMMRIGGEMEVVDELPPADEEKLREDLVKIIPTHYLPHFQEKDEICFVQDMGERMRFRVHLFRDRRGFSAVFRKIPLTYVNAVELGVPDQVIRLCFQPRGLILVTGSHGSGKTTTLASLVDVINRNQKRHIMVLEHPMEYLHWNKLSLIHQKECGPSGVSERDLAGIGASDVDVVALGEMRSAEVLQCAMEMASHGYLVMGILPTLSAVGAIDHIINLSHPMNRSHTGNMLAGCLLGVLSQVLCRTKGEGGRIVAFEVLTVNPAVINLIREGKTYQLATLMQPGNAGDNRLLNDVLVKLVETDMITPAEAFFRTYDAEGIRNRLKQKGTARS